jgi:hypothetical protein
MKTIFFRLLQADDKDACLQASIAAANSAVSVPEAFDVDPASFRQVPGSPFAYWVSENVRRLFKELPQFESDSRSVRVGMQTSDDFRFIRCWWEVTASSLLSPGDGPKWREAVSDFQDWCRKQTHQGKRWIPIAKGGTYAPFFDEPQMVVNWERDGEEMKRWTESLYDGTSWSRNIRNTDFYFRPGITWPLRGIRLSAQAVPAGGCFSIAGKLATSDDADELSPLLGLMNSLAFDYLVGFFAGKVGGVQYEVGLIGKVPVPAGIKHEQLSRLSENVSKLAATSLIFKECRHSFPVPELLAGKGTSLADRIDESRFRLEEVQTELAEQYSKLDDLAFQIYRIESVDRRAMQAGASLNIPRAEGVQAEDDEPGDDIAPVVDGKPLAAALLSYVTGCVVGRWDLRFGTGERVTPELLDPFDPLPVCSPGMLQGDDGLPLLHTPEGYPLRINWDGILIDDPDHDDDIVRRARDVFELIWKDRAEAIEAEAREILGVSDFRDYFRKPGAGGFWDDHIKRYSKSRRKAPIYWLLQSSKKNYALWIYYHRLEKDILFKALLNLVEPKIRKEEARLAEFRAQKAALDPAAKGAKKLDKDVDRQEDFLSERRDFEDKLQRAANLSLEPDLNDGVILNIAPLHELVPWKEAKKYWEELLAGKYEWSTIGKQLRAKGLVK